MIKESRLRLLNFERSQTAGDSYIKCRTGRKVTQCGKSKMRLELEVELTFNGSRS